MSDIDKKYAEVEKILKATFFDAIHENFAVLDLGKISDPAIINLASQQQKNINKALGLLNALIRTVNEVKDTGTKISDAIVENTLVDIDNFELGKTDSSEVGDTVEEKNVNNEVITENVAANDESQIQQGTVLPSVIPTEDVSSPVSNEVVETPVVVPPVTGDSSETTSEEAKVEPTNENNDVVVETPAVVPPVTSDSSETASEEAKVEPTSENNDVVVETPVTEVTSDFVLTPINDKQTPLQPTVDNVIPTDNVEENATKPAEQAVSVEVKTQFVKTSPDSTRAILVSKNQIDKLFSSRDAQKEEVPLTVTVEEEAIDPQVQVQQLMTQANQLYNEGKREEAQEIMNQISGLTKSLQSEQNGVVLQKKA